MHRQRRDDRERRPLRPSGWLIRIISALDAYATGEQARWVTAYVVTVYSKPDCHLCVEAMAALERAARRALRAARGPSSIEHADERLHRAYFERIPIGPRRRGAERLLVDEAVLRRAGSLESQTMSMRGEAAPSRARSGPSTRAPIARRRGPPVALPAGADAGEEDGQGDDLLAGALGLHARQLDADPPRPLRLRQVRQARSGLQRRVAGLADPQDPAHRGAAQHRPDRRGPSGPGDRVLGDLRRPRLPRRGDLRQRPREGRHHGWQPGRPPHRRAAPGRRGEDIVVGVLAVPAAAAQGLADELVARA